MNKKYSTDLQVAKDLEKLAEVINESIDRAEGILKKAKEVDEVKKLIAEINRSREELLKSQETVKKIAVTVSDRLQEAQSIEENLHSLKQLPKELQKIGDVEQIKKLLQEVKDARLELINSQYQLSLTQQETTAIQGLENYLQNLQNIRNRKQLWDFLLKELGFIGVIVYLLSLLTPQRNNRR